MEEVFTITFKKGELSALSSAMVVAAAFLKSSAQCEADIQAAEHLKNIEENLWEKVVVNPKS